MLTAILKIVPCWELIDDTSYKWIHLKTASACYTGETLLNTYNRNTEENLEISCTTNSNGNFYMLSVLFARQCCLLRSGQMVVVFPLSSVYWESYVPGWKVLLAQRIPLKPSLSSEIGWNWCFMFLSALHCLFFLFILAVPDRQILGIRENIMKYLLFFMKHLAGLWQDQGISKCCHFYMQSMTFFVVLNGVQSICK